MVESDPSEHAGYAGVIPSWHHVECFLEHLDDLDASGVSAQEISGFTKLKKPDKDELAKKLPAAKTGTSSGKG